MEPEVSIHLRVCTRCRGWLVKRQIQIAEEEEAEAGGFHSDLQLMYKKFCTSEANVSKQLPLVSKYFINE